MESRTMYALSPDLPQVRVVVKISKARRTLSGVPFLIVRVCVFVCVCVCVCVCVLVLRQGGRVGALSMLYGLRTRRNGTKDSLDWTKS